ncbi:MAG: hypothetical protein RMZ41_007440 [Nostoc sp. DedVER02]
MIISQVTKINICHSIFVKKLLASCLISGAVVAIAICYFLLKSGNSMNTIQ